MVLAADCLVIDRRRPSSEAVFDELRDQWAQQIGAAELDRIEDHLTALAGRQATPCATAAGSSPHSRRTGWAVLARAPPRPDPRASLWRPGPTGTGSRRRTRASPRP